MPAPSIPRSWLPSLLLVAAACSPEPPPQVPAPSPPPVTSAPAPPPPTPPPTPTAEVTGCISNLNAESVARLRMAFGSGRSIGPGEQIDVSPGDRIELRVGHYSVPGAPVDPVNACVRWSVAEAGMATIDADKPTLTVLPSARGTLHVRAKVLGTGTTVSGELVVIAKELAPLVGIWKEEARLDCKTKQWAAPAHPIHELHVRAQGKLLVTWMPFETAYDYVAPFVWDPVTGKMSLRVEAVNYAPRDVRTAGTARVDGGALIFEGIWLGSAPRQVETPACAHRFVR